MIEGRKSVFFVAVPMALEDLSDTYWRTVWRKESDLDALYRERFIEKLTFFAHISELVKTSNVILIPNRLQELHDEKARSASVSSTVVELILILNDENFEDDMILPNGTWHGSRATAAVIAAKEVIALLDLCSEHGYDLAFDLNLFSGVFRSIRQNRPLVSPKKLRAWTTETQVKVPKLGFVDVETFLSARKAESFESFALT